MTWVQGWYAPPQKRAKLSGPPCGAPLDELLCDGWYWILGEFAGSMSWSPLAPTVAAERRSSSSGSIGAVAFAVKPVFCVKVARVNLL